MKKINEIKTSSISDIDLSAITTFGELRNALPSTGTRLMPGINQLRERANLLLSKKTEGGVIEIYDNGCFAFEECRRTTVYSVDRCEWPETYSASGKRESGMQRLDFSAYPWALILESAGSARLGRTQEGCEVCQEEYALDAPASENNIAFSVRPTHEIREEEEKMAVWRDRRKKTLFKKLERLTEKQRQIMMMDRVEKLTQEEIADRMGISRCAVRAHLGAISNKLDR